MKCYGKFPKGKTPECCIHCNVAVECYEATNGLDKSQPANDSINNPIHIECPICHKYTELTKSSGTYYGRCMHCKPGVKFSVVIIERVTK